MCWEHDGVPRALWTHRPCQACLPPRLHDQVHKGLTHRFLTGFGQIQINPGLALCLLLLQQVVGDPDQPEDQGDRDEVEGAAQEEDHPRVRPLQGQEDL